MHGVLTMPAPETDWTALLRAANGLDLLNADTQADWIMEQMLEGARVVEGNRIQIMNYLVMHLKAAEERGRKTQMTSTTKTDPRWRT